jgi:hypothetical protein
VSGVVVTLDASVEQRRRVDWLRRSCAGFGYIEWPAASLSKLACMFLPREQRSGKKVRNYN